MNGDDPQGDPRQRLRRKKREILDSILQEPGSDLLSDEEVLRRVRQVATSERNLPRTPLPVAAPIVAAPPPTPVEPYTPRPIMERPRPNQLSENLRDMARSFTTPGQPTGDIPLLPAPVYPNAPPPRPSAAGLTALPLSERLRPAPDPDAPPPIYTAPRGNKEQTYRDLMGMARPDSYRMKSLEVGPQGVSIGKPHGFIEDKLLRAPYERTTHESPFVDLEKIQAADAKLTARLADPNLTPEEHDDLKAVQTNLQQQMELGRRFGMGGVGASGLKQFGLQAYDAVTMGWSGAEYQKELAKRYADGTFIHPQDVEAVLGEPLGSSTTPVPGGAGVAGQFAGGAAVFMGGETALGKATQALAGSRFRALARPAEAYFDLAYRPIQPGTSALGYALKRGGQGAFQGAPIGVGMDAIRAVNEGTPIDQGIIEGGKMGALMGGLLEAALPFHLGGAGAPVTFGRHARLNEGRLRDILPWTGDRSVVQIRDDMLGRAADQPFSRGFEAERRTVSDDRYTPGRDPQYATETRTEGYAPGMDPQYAGRDIRPDVAGETRPYPQRADEGDPNVKTLNVEVGERADAGDQPQAQEMPGAVVTPGDRLTQERIRDNPDPIAEARDANPLWDTDPARERARALEEAAGAALPPDAYRGPERRSQLPSVTADDIINRHRRRTDAGYVEGAHILGGMAAGGAAGLGLGALLGDDEEDALAGLGAGMVLGGVAGLGFAARGRPKRMEFPRLPERPTSFLGNERGAVGAEGEGAPRAEESEVLEQGFATPRDAGLRAKALTAKGVEVAVRKADDGLYEIVREPKALVRQEPPVVQEPYRPGAPPQENRPPRGSKGWRLEVDPQGRFFSRLGRHLESIPPGEAKTAAEWMADLGKKNRSEYSKEEYEMVLKPVLEKVAQGDPANVVFPWLQGRMDYIADPNESARGIGIPPETWAERKLTGEDLLSLASNNRLRLENKVFGGVDKAGNANRQVEESWTRDPLGYARDVAAWEAAGNDVEPSSHDAWTEHLSDLEREVDEAEGEMESAWDTIDSRFGIVSSNIQRRINTALSDARSEAHGDYAGSQTYQRWRRALVELAEEANQERLSEAAGEHYDERLSDIRYLGDDLALADAQRINSRLGGDVLPTDLKMTYNAEEGVYEVVDGDGDSYFDGSAHEDAGTVWANLIEESFESELRDLATEAVEDVTDLISYDEIDDALETAWEATAEYDRNEGTKEMYDNYEEEEIREWLENEGHDVGTGEEKPDAAAYGLDLRHAQETGNNILLAAAEPATADRERGLIVYDEAGRYYTPEEARQWEADRQDRWETLSPEITWVRDHLNFQRHLAAWRDPRTVGEWADFAAQVRSRFERLVDIPFETRLTDTFANKNRWRGVPDHIRADVLRMLDEAATHNRPWEDVKTDLRDWLQANFEVPQELERQRMADDIQQYVIEQLRAGTSATQITGKDLNAWAGRFVVQDDAKMYVYPGPPTGGSEYRVVSSGGMPLGPPMQTAHGAWKTAVAENFGKAEDISRLAVDNDHPMFYGVVRDYYTDRLNEHTARTEQAFIERATREEVLEYLRTEHADEYTHMLLDQEPDPARYKLRQNDDGEWVTTDTDPPGFWTMGSWWPQQAGTRFYDNAGRWLDPVHADYWPVKRDAVAYPADPVALAAGEPVPALPPLDPNVTRFEPAPDPADGAKLKSHYSGTLVRNWTESLLYSHPGDLPLEAPSVPQPARYDGHFGVDVKNLNVHNFQVFGDVTMPDGRPLRYTVETQGDITNQLTSPRSGGAGRHLREPAKGRRLRTFKTEKLTIEQAGERRKVATDLQTEAYRVQGEAEMKVRSSVDAFLRNTTFPAFKEDAAGNTLLDPQGRPIPLETRDKMQMWLDSDEGKVLRSELENAQAEYRRHTDERYILDRILTENGGLGPTDVVEVERVENQQYGEVPTWLTSNTEVGRLGATRALVDWAENGTGNLFGWQNAEQVVGKWFEKNRDLYTAIYDGAMPKGVRAHLQYLAQVDPTLREMGFRATDVTIENHMDPNDVGPYNNQWRKPWQGWIAEVPDRFVEPLKAAILRNGLSIMGLAPFPLLAVWANDPDATDEERAVRQQWTKAATTLGKGLLVAGAIGLAAYGARRMAKGGRGRLGDPRLGELPMRDEHVGTSDPADLLGGGQRKATRVAGRGPLPRLTEKELTRLDLPPELEKEVLATMQRQRAVMGEPEPFTWAESIALAQQELDMKGDALMDLDPTRATAEQIIAIASLAGQKKRTANLFHARAVAPDLSASEQRANAQMAEKLDEDFLNLFIGSMRGSSEAGRTLNAMKILANLRSDPEYWWRRTMKHLDRPLTPKERDTIRGFLDAEDRAGLVQYLARMKKTSIPSQIVTLLNAGLFTRPAARALDLISSGGNLILENGLNAPARVLLDRAVALGTGTRTAALPDALQMEGIGRGAWHGLKESAKSMGWNAVGEAGPGNRWQAWVDYMRNVEMTPEMLARYDLPHLTNIDMFSLSRNPEAPLNVIMDAAQKTVYRTLGVTDRILVKAAYEGAIADLAMARALTEKAEVPKRRAEELIANPPDDMRFDAMLMASRITFNNEETAAVMGKKIMQAPGAALKKVEGPAGEMAGEFANAAMRWQFPVVRTAANITARVTDYIPGIGTTRGFYNLMQAFRKDLEPSLRNRKQRVAVEVLSRNLSGAGLVALGVYLHQQGIMTGAASTDVTERNIERGTGQSPNSILWQGEWRPLGRLAPFGTLLAVGATLDQIASHKAKTGDALGYGAGAAFAVGRTILDQPFLSGSRSALDALQDPVTRSESYLESQVGRVVPTIVSEIAQADGISRDVNGPWDAVKARTPGLRQTLPIRYTGLGDVQRGRTGLMNRLFNPIAGSPDLVEGDPLLGKMRDLGWMPGGISRDKGSPTEPAETPQEYSRRQAFIGGLRRTMLGRAMSTHPLFTDPAYLDEAARTQQANNPDYAGMSLDEVKTALQREFTKSVVRDVSPHTPPEKVPAFLGGTRP